MTNLMIFSIFLEDLFSAALMKLRARVAVLAVVAVWITVSVYFFVTNGESRWTGWCFDVFAMNQFFFLLI